MSAFKVISSNKGEIKGNYITKISRETTENTVFGAKTKKETYYVSSNTQVAVDTMIAEKDIFPKFRVQEYPMINPDTKEEFMGKWLHLA